MPIKVRKFNAQVRDPESGQMVPAGLLSSDALEAIDEAKQDAIDAVEARAEEIEQDWPADYSDLTNSVNNLSISAEEFNYLKNNLIRDISENLYNSATALPNKIIRTNGNIETAPGYETCDYIQVNEGDVLSGYYLPGNGTVYSANMNSICAFSENKTPISSAGTGTSSSTYTVPAGIKFVRISHTSGVTNYMILKNATQAPRYYIPYTNSYIASSNLINDTLEEINYDNFVKTSYYPYKNKHTMFLNYRKAIKSIYIPNKIENISTYYLSTVMYNKESQSWVGKKTQITISYLLNNALHTIFDWSAIDYQPTNNIEYLINNNIIICIDWSQIYNGYGYGPLGNYHTELTEDVFKKDYTFYGKTKSMIDEVESDINNLTNDVNNCIDTVNSISGDIEDYVNDYLDNHPGSAVNIPDDSILLRKLNTTLQQQVLNSYVTPQMFGAYGDNNHDDTTAISSAIDYAVTNNIELRFPKGTYKITDTINKECFGIIRGDNNLNSVISFVPNSGNKALFNITGSSMYSRNNTFQDIRIYARAQSDLVFLTGDHENIGFYVKNCRIETSGYNFKFTNGWKYFSRIQSCWNDGGGFIYAVPSNQEWYGGQYPHSFSNLTIRDCHFSAGTNLLKGPIIIISGGCHTMIDNVELQGHAKDFVDGYRNLGNYGSYITLINSSGIISNVWCETGGNQNVIGRDLAFITLDGTSAVSDESIINVINCKTSSNIYVGKNDENVYNYAVPIAVTIEGLTIFETGKPKFTVGNFGHLTVKDCLIMSNSDPTSWDFDTNRIKFENLMKTNNNSTNGDIVVIN